MKTKVELATQVLGFISQMAPQPKKQLREALHRLEEGKADIKRLEGRLEGYHRLRSGSYRIIFRQIIRHGKPVAECVYAGPRDVIYQLFTDIIAGG